MKKCSNSIKETIDILKSIEFDQDQTSSVSKENTTDEIKLETIIEYLDKSKEMLSKFKDFDLGEDDSSRPLMMRRRWLRRLIGHILVGVGTFLNELGKRLISDNPPG